VTNVRTNLKRRARSLARRVAYLPVIGRGRAVRRARKAAACVASAPPVPAGSVPRNGIVETFERRQVAGWVETEPGAVPTRVAMYIGETETVGTWAVNPVERRGDGEVREFRLALADFWEYARKTDRVSVRAAGHPLPIVNRGFFYYPRTNGGRSLGSLRNRQGEGWVFGQTGRLQLSKSCDFVWQAKVMGLYERVRAAVCDAFGYDVFLIYGSLLGAVREGGFIGHDLDFDCAYVSSYRTGQGAAAELADIAIALIDRGFDVESRTITLHVQDGRSGGVRLDLFHLFFDEAGMLQFPFGVAGQSEVHLSHWQGTMEIPLGGSVALIPANGAEMVEHIYGPTWRMPNPGFNWRRDRTRKAVDARVPVELGAAVYWSNFYAHTSFDKPSSFFAAVAALPRMPAIVVDLGCGDGRDSIAFARTGRRVLGLDRAPRAVQRARGAARTKRVGRRTDFAVCEFGDAAAVRSALEDVRRAAEDRVLFYARFLLHGMTDEVARTLLQTVRALAVPGDVFAAEFRTIRDEGLPKVFPRPYRRFVDGAAVAAELTDDGWAVEIHQEGNGFAPFGTEDPQLCRLIARYVS
jgi:SAM-dependent methyltransferase